MHPYSHYSRRGWAIIARSAGVPRGLNGKLQPNEWGRGLASEPLCEVFAVVAGLCIETINDAIGFVSSR